MRLPTPLLRQDKKAHKNRFGHVLVVAGSQRMLGACVLCGQAAMRTGAGLVTLAVPRSLNLTLQKKISPVLMTWPLPETGAKSFSLSAFTALKKEVFSYQALAIGPGLGRQAATQALVKKVVRELSVPMVIDADALNALACRMTDVAANPALKVLTPHPGEMARMTGRTKKWIENNRKKAAADFAATYGCVLLLKGHQTVVAAPDGRTYLNTTGNSGMATAGSGDVLTGMLTALLAQGLSAFDAAKVACYLHGLAGDLAVKKTPKACLLATDLIDLIPRAIQTKA